MEVTSEIALRAYQLVFLGVDRLLGRAYDRDARGRPIPLRIPRDIRWYVRHTDVDIDDSFVEELASEIERLRLPGLSLAGCRHVTATGFMRLRSIKHLQTIDLFNTQIDNKTIEAIAEIEQLETLNLAGTKVTASGLARLARCEKLLQLHLGWTDIDDSVLVELGRLKTLRSLVLRNTRVTDQGLHALAALPCLEDLDLQETAVGDAGVAALRPLAGRLKRLYLGYTPVTDSAVEGLKSFRGLRALMLRATTVDRTAEAQLKAALTALGGLVSGPDGVQEGLIW
jgi:hypothetical protein